MSKMKVEQIKDQAEQLITQFKKKHPDLTPNALLLSYSDYRLFVTFEVKGGGVMHQGNQYAWKGLRIIQDTGLHPGQVNIAYILQ
ncbi:hypothetical protein [uncultured Draconibacterium sp.]|uniref:hypothetical protein n=1 Tax=uncultured Draconibacterium sp. TaxID=1573823 RepID=UPI0029C7C6B9|nr:hypothetical protein [uncultured Draconibacterium sp.]